MEVMKSPAEADGPAQDARSLVLMAAWLAFPPLAQGHSGPAVLAEAGEMFLGSGEVAGDAGGSP